MNERYKRIGHAGLMVDLSIIALEEAALNMRPSRTYTLFVEPRLYVLANMIVKSIGATTKDNPLAPCINAVILRDLQPREWFVEGDAGDAWGSIGP